MDNKIIEAQAIESIEVFTIKTGSRIRQQRQALKKSIRTLAKETKISISTISQLEKGKSLPSLYTLFRLSLALGVEDLFGQYNPSKSQKEDIVPVLNSLGLTGKDVEHILNYIEFLRYGKRNKKSQYKVK